MNITSKEQIRKEVESWNLEEFTDSTIDDVMTSVDWYLKYQENDLNKAFDYINQAIEDGNL